MLVILPVKHVIKMAIVLLVNIIKTHSIKIALAQNVLKWNMRRMEIVYLVIKIVMDAGSLTKTNVVRKVSTFIKTIHLRHVNNAKILIAKHAN